MRLTQPSFPQRILEARAMPYLFAPAYPTEQHARAADRVTQFFSSQKDVEAVLLTCSCARGKASRDSCLDIDILVRPETPPDRRQALEAAWAAETMSQPVYAELKAAGLYSQVDLNFCDGQFNPDGHGWTSGADEFELAIGNLLAYSSPLWVGGSYLDDLRHAWLPYYPEALRCSRAEMVRRFCLNNLDHIPLYVGRGLYFQAFNRLFHALGEFLQALFIQRRVYPIAYDKWVREQIVDILGLPELYPQLTHLLEIQVFESGEMIGKAESLRKLLDEYIPV
jgi:predicted nucleotidyltransferase